nr:lysozyme inhibitor LprI family protein [Fredinandcohnia sp. SECRCQ15]
MGCGADNNEKAASDVKQESGEYKEETDSKEKVVTEKETKEKTDSENKNEDKEDTVKDDITVNTKQEYLKKLKDVENTVADLDKKLEAATTQADMNQVQGEIFKVWDGALNEIYGALKKQISDGEMSNLRDEQRDWITHRDEVAKEESSEYEGGTMESLQYLMTQTRITKERCYELVNKYMK